MKLIDIIILSLVAVAVVLGIRRIIGVISGRRSCCSGDVKSSAKRFRRVRIRDTDESHYPYRADLTIAGMSCENCVKNVEAALDSLSGTWATVDLASRTAHVRSKNPIDVAVYGDVVREAGYRIVS